MSFEFMTIMVSISTHPFPGLIENIYSCVISTAYISNNAHLNLIVLMQGDRLINS